MKLFITAKRWLLLHANSEFIIVFLVACVYALLLSTMSKRANEVAYAKPPVQKNTTPFATPAISVKEQIKLKQLKSLPPSSGTMESKVPNSLSGSLIWGDVYADIRNNYSTFLDLRLINSTVIQKRFAFDLKRPGTIDNAKRFEVYGALFDPVFSPNGKYVMFKLGDYGATGIYRLYVYDISTGKTYAVSDAILNYYAISWSPDSKYIAFAKGGSVDPRIYGNGRTYSNPLDLCVTNWKTGNTDKIVTSSELRGDWHWIAPHTLIFGDMQSQDAKFRNNPRYQAGVDFKNGEPVGWERLQGEPKRKPVTANVYAYNVDQHQKRLLFTNGYHPYASPDGKYVAYFGSKNGSQPMYLNKHWKDAPAGQYLMVGQLPHFSPIKDTQNRISQIKLIGQFYKSYPMLLWSNDSKKLLLFKVKDVSQDHYLIEIRIWNMEDGQWKTVTTISLKDAPGEEYPVRSSHIPVYSNTILSPNGKQLIIFANEYYKHGNSFSIKEYVKEINLGDGSIHNIATINTPLGASWTYNSVTPSSTNYR